MMAHAAGYPRAFSLVVLLSFGAIGNPVPSHEFRQPTAVDTSLLAPDPADSLLVACRLGRLTGHGFMQDGYLTSDWSSLSGTDSLRLTAPTHCMPGRCAFAGTDDAALTVRAMVRYDGLYLLIVVEDDEWIAPDDYVTDTTTDMVHIFLSMDEGTAICDGVATDCLVGSGEACAHQLSYHSIHMLLPAGGGPPELGMYTELPMRYTWYSEDEWTFVTYWMGYGDAEDLFGIVPDRAILGPNKRTFEVFVPWGTYCGGIPYDSLLGGPIGFSVGYDDRDSNGTPPASLRWLAGDPTMPVGDDCYWANIWVNPLEPPDGPPVLHPHPCDTTYDLLQRVSWYEGAADGIRFQVATTETFDDSSVIMDSVVAQGESGIVTDTLPYGHVYYRVAPADAPADFGPPEHVIAAPLRPPTLLSPADSAVLTPDSVLRWDFVDDTGWFPCSYYPNTNAGRQSRLFIWHDGDTVAVERSTFGQTLNRVNPALQTGDTFHWCVQAFTTTANQSECSEPRVFVLQPSGVHRPAAHMSAGRTARPADRVLFDLRGRRLPRTPPSMPSGVLVETVGDRTRHVLRSVTSIR